MTVKDGEEFTTIMINAGATVADERITADVVKPYGNVEDFVVEDADKKADADKKLIQIKKPKQKKNNEHL